MPPPVAASLQALRADWFTHVLQRGGHAQAAVREVSLQPLAFSGAAADIARVSLRYDDHGSAGPASLIAKIRGAGPTKTAMDAAMNLYEREARFYSTLAAQVPVRSPRCYYVGDGTLTPLLLEDLGGLRVGDQMQGLEVADAQRLMDILADLHARFWNDPPLQQMALASPATGVFAQMIVQLVGSGIAALRERYSGRIAQSAIDAVAALAPRWNDVLACGAQGPQTLVHNDCRLDNVFFDRDGEPVLVDWQIVARTRGTQDVGNLLAGSMEPPLLREHWEALLRRYHDRIKDRGVRDYSWSDCVAHYRQNILYPLGAGIALLGQLDIGDSRGLGDVIILRALQHCADLDAFSAIRSL